MAPTGLGIVLSVTRPLIFRVWHARLSEMHETKYHIRINIGEELNMANWQIVMQSPNLNFTHIFYSTLFVTLVAFGGNCC